MSKLNSFGWNSFFQDQFIPFKKEGFIPCRISVENKQRYLLLSEFGEIPGEITGKLLYSSDQIADLPKVGDWVAAVYFEDERKAIIHHVLKRKTKLSRKSADKKIEEQVIAANIDIIFIVQSLDNNFNLRRLDRYLKIAIDSKAVPFIILNKTDLAEDLNFFKQQIDNHLNEIKTIYTNTINQKGIEEIKEIVKVGMTSVFIGSSGVGKSSIINCLLGNEVLKTNSISESVNKGKHTTTKRELVMIPGGGMIIDTPGMRELQLWNEGNLENSFTEIYEFAEQCKFKDCSHTVEKDCAVLEAVENGKLSQNRLISFRKFMKELDYLESKQDKNAFLLKKEKEKQLGKMIKKYFKNGKYK